MTSKPTSKKSKKVSSLDNIHGGTLTRFSKVVGGSLAGELKAFNMMATAMGKGQLSVNGAKATIAKVEAEVGSLPSFRSAWCQDILLVVALQAKEGGKDATLKSLFNVAIQGRKAFGGKAQFIEIMDSTNSFEAIELQIPSQGERKNTREAHHNEKGEKVEKVEKVQSIAQLLAEIGKRFKAGEQVEDVKLLEAVAIAVAKELTRARASKSMTKATNEIAVELAKVA